MPKIFRAYIAGVILAILLFVAAIVFSKIEGKENVKSPNESSRFLTYHSFHTFSVVGSQITLVECMPDFDTNVIIRNDSIFFSLPYGRNINYKTVKVEDSSFYGEIYGLVTKFNLVAHDSIITFRPSPDKLILLSKRSECPKQKP